MFVRGRLASFIGGHPRAVAVVFVRGCSSSYVRGRFRMCRVVFEQMRVSGVVGMDVLWSSRTVVVVVWSLWTHRGWGRCGRMGRGGRGQRGWGRCGCGCGGRGHRGCGGSCPRPRPLLLLLVGYGGHCQSCDGKMGTELTYDGDDVAVPRRLPARSAVGAGDVALSPSDGACGVGCRRLTMVVGIGGCKRGGEAAAGGLLWKMVVVEEEAVECC